MIFIPLPQLFRPYCRYLYFLTFALWLFCAAMSAHIYFATLLCWANAYTFVEFNL